MSSERPVVLCFSGHDPCGGAGIQADMEVLISHKCHAASVITALTEQDTLNVKKVIPQRVNDFLAQVRTVMADLPVKAIKIGLIGDAKIAKAIHDVLVDHPAIPVVFDPILAAGGGKSLADVKLRKAILELILPLSFIATPNSAEATTLAQTEVLSTAAETLLQTGCKHLLITGADEPTRIVQNRFYQPGKSVQTFDWDRLPGTYHGSGCTLASSIAALLAHGLDIFVAVNEAQEYTWNSLQAAYQTGAGQLNPNRLFWVDNER